MTMPTASVPASIGLDAWHDLIESGHITRGDALIAARICRLCAESPESSAALALVLAIRAVREGSTALDVESAAAWPAEQDDTVMARGSEVAAEAEANSVAVPARLAELRDLPAPSDWLETVGRSKLVTQGVLHVDLELVYLDRYYRDETSIADRLLLRSQTMPTSWETGADPRELNRLHLNKAQEIAVTSVLNRTTTVLTGGPGMGKTHTIGGVLTAIRAAGGADLRIALAAPTGKAAARMSESLAEQGIELADAATTLHRLLGSIPGTSQRFRHDRRNPLPHDLVVIDEASMISLSMMARLLEALPDSTRLLLVGDPDQLSSVEAGSVLRDVAEGLGSARGVVRLTQEFRLATRRADLAKAFRRGDAEAVLEIVEAATSQTDHSELRFVDTAGAASTVPDLTALPDVVTHAETLRELALAGRRDDAVAALGRTRLLCAHRSGPFGTRRWNRIVEQALAERWPDVSHQEMYAGRPVLVTRNDYGLGVTNGDTGIVVRTGTQLTAAFTTESGLEDLSPWRLGDIETMHAMTVHKAQGSQADDVTVIVPPLDSPLLTREMLYTAVTRARRSLTIVGTREAIRTAVLSPAQRSSGLGRRLREADPGP